MLGLQFRLWGLGFGVWVDGLKQRGGLRDTPTHQQLPQGTIMVISGPLHIPSLPLGIRKP